jgi:hypothetical protein
MWWKSDPSFVTLAERALAATPILAHIAAGREAVVLERHAYGAGYTTWYSCRSPGDLAALTTELKPRSLVSFYFDGRIRRTADRSFVRAEVERITAVEPDAVSGALAPDGLHIQHWCVCGLADLEEFLAELDGPRDLFVGAFPDRDNDGVRAVTFVLPDADGVVRRHCY